MIEIKKLTYAYPFHPPILKEISFTIPTGTLFGLFGANGSGKSTLFRCLTNFITGWQGQVLIGNENLKKLSYATLAKQIAHVPQEHLMPFAYSVFEMVLLGRTPHLPTNLLTIPTAEKKLVWQQLEYVGIKDLAQQNYNQLSGGQKQLVLLARALVQETPYLFLDEPTSALDFANQIKVWQILRQIVDEQKKTILVCTHNPNHIAWFCDRALLLNAQQIQEGDVEEILSQKNLNAIYPDLCAIEQCKQHKVILPNNLKLRYSVLPTL